MKKVFLLILIASTAAFSANAQKGKTPFNYGVGTTMYNAIYLPAVEVFVSPGHFEASLLYKYSEQNLTSMNTFGAGGSYNFFKDRSNIFRGTLSAYYLLNSRYIYHENPDSSCRFTFRDQFFVSAGAQLFTSDHVSLGLKYGVLFDKHFDNVSTSLQISVRYYFKSFNNTIKRNGRYY